MSGAFGVEANSELVEEGPSWCCAATRLVSTWDVMGSVLRTGVVPIGSTGGIAVTVDVGWMLTP